MRKLLAGVQELLVLDDIDLPDRRRPQNPHPQAERASGPRLVALEVFPVARLQAVVQHDVVRGAVVVPLLHGVQQPFAGELLGDRAGVGVVGREVVRGGLHAQLVALGPGVPDIAGGPEASRLRAGPLAVGRQRRAFVFGGNPVALEDLDQGLDFGVVVAPVGSHAGRGRVRDRDASVAAQVGVEAGRSLLVIPFLRQHRQGRRAALGQQDVAVPVRKRDRTLVAVEGLEPPGHRKDVDRLLQDPVDVGLVGPLQVVVLADQQIVQAGRVEGVPVGVEERAVVVAVHRKLRVAVRVAAVDAVGPPPGIDLVGPQPLQVLDFGGGQIVELDRSLLPVPQDRRRGRAIQGRQPSRPDIRVVVEEFRKVAVVDRPSREQPALAIRRDPPAHVLAARAEREFVRRGPGVSVQRGGPDFPGGPVQGRLVGHVALADRAMSAEQPDAALAVERQLREVVVEAVDMRRQRTIDVGGGLVPAASVPNRHAHQPGTVEERALDRQQEAGVLAPVQAAFVPGRPEPVLGIHGQRRVRLVERRVGDGLGGPPGLAVPSPQNDVVVALVVGVPSHMDLALAACGHDGFPVVRGGLGEALLRTPGLAVVPPREDVRLAVPETLPDQPQAPVRRAREVGERIRLGRLGQALRAGPGTVLQRASVQIEIAVRLMRPDEPDGAVLGAAQLDEMDIAGFFRHRLRRAPGTLFVNPGEDLVGSVAEGDPGGAGRILGRPAENRREIVLVRVGGQRLDGRHAVDDRRAIEELQRFAQPDGANREREIPLRRLEPDLGARTGPHLEDHAGRPVVDLDGSIRQVLVGSPPVVDALVRGEPPASAGVDLVFGPGMPIADAQQFAARNARGAVPAGLGGVAEPETDSHRDRVFGQRRNGAGEEAAGGQENERKTKRDQHGTRSAPTGA